MCWEFPQKSFQKGNWHPRRTWNETHQFHATSSRKPSLAAPSNRNYGFCLEGADLQSNTKKMRSQRERRPISGVSVRVQLVIFISKRCKSFIYTFKLLAFVNRTILFRGPNGPVKKLPPRGGIDGSEPTTSLNKILQL